MTISIEVKGIFQFLLNYNFSLGFSFL